MEKDIIILKLDYESELVIGKNYKILLNLNDVDIIQYPKDYFLLQQPGFISKSGKYFSSKESAELLIKYNGKYVDVEFVGPSRITGENLFYFNVKKYIREEKLNNFLND